ncbi:MAG: AAA family ATPase [Candidatus Aminicenantes bacterium RBG_13_63_10]|nr:MAG: AAA family ATPase [Candidatus Aminicenantes bacterium RBG_13_63_10]
MESTSRHLFITGKAGTGKSTLLDYFRTTTRKRVAVLAPTGVAALNVRGQTIHSFCRFKPDITLDKVKKISGKGGALYKNLDAVIIDEISMVRADLLDCIERFLRLNRPHPSEPFGGLQMIFIGDLYQLPPVVSSTERGIFSNQYDSPYFFSSRIFSDPGFDMEFVELEKIYRQTEEDFIALLNAIRNRSVTDEDIVRLNRRCDSGFVPPDEDFTIHLTTTNDLAYMRNREKLTQLPGRAFRYPGSLEGKFDKSHLPTDELLELKRGAQVMMVNNDANGRWVNGSLGRIAGVEKTPDAPDLLRVELQDGFKVDVAPYTWELFKLDFDERAGKLVTETIGSFTQYPLRLAWAVTIHKSQGKTFDKVVIDIGRGTFAHGQVYVALSRCTSFGGIVLKKEIKKSHIRMDWRVIRFLTRYQYQKADDRLSYADKIALIREAIQAGRDLEIVYLKPDDTKTRRRIRPESVEPMEYMGKRFEGVRAHCFKRGEERHFRIDRMLEVTPAE